MKFLKFLEQFIFSKGKFFPPYFWITVFLTILVLILILKVFYTVQFLFVAGRLEPLQIPISDELILGYLGFVAAWLAIYTKWGKKSE